MAIIFNIQRFSTEDGPGIRTTVFIKGCPLLCLWCSNPESQKGIPEVVHRDSLCNKCGRCVGACDVSAISITDSGIKIDREICTNCGKCVDVCMPGAITIYGKEMSADEVFQTVIKDRDFYKSSGGGVTVSGGEALTQADFVENLFKRCQDANIHTCLDTCGYPAYESWNRVLQFTNLVLFDLKLFNSAEHHKVTGRSNENVLRNLDLIIKAKVPVIIRIPIIPGINDSVDNLGSIARLIASLDDKIEVNLLPYHRYGESKYIMLDREYPLSKVIPPEESRLETLAGIFKSLNINTKIKK